MSSLQARAAFAIPERTQEHLTFAKADASSIQQWLDDLPKANRGETARRFYFALQEMNKVRLPVNTRLQIMELMRPGVYDTCNALFGQHLKKSLSLSEKERKVAELAQVLQGFLLTGYKIAISDLLDGNRDKKSLIVSIHRATTDSSHILLRCYQLYTPPPRKLWKELHTLYLLADKNGITQASFKNEESSTLSLSIADSYKRSLLLSRARPNMLRQNELDQVFEALEQWASNATLEPKITENSAFAISVTSDAAPVYTVDTEIDNPKKFIGLNTQNLVSLISKICERGGGGRNALPPKLLHHLLSSWGFKTDRDHNRIPISGTISFAAGLSATHFYTFGETPFHAILAAFDASHDTTSKPVFESQGETDSWDRLAAGPAGAGNRMTAVAGDMVIFDGDSANAQTTYPLIQASLVNVSPGGYCAKMQSPVPAQIQTGEIIAIRSPSGYQWMLAVIRWVKIENDDEVVFGIQHISANVWPSAISIIHKDRHASNFLRCFYLPDFKELNQPAYLITPRVPFQIGSRVRFFNGKELITATLTECKITTGSISQYTFKPYNPILAYTENDMIHMPSSQKQGVEDEFSTLWTDL